MEPGKAVGRVPPEEQSKIAVKQDVPNVPLRKEARGDIAVKQGEASEQRPGVSEASRAAAAVLAQAAKGLLEGHLDMTRVRRVLKAVVSFLPYVWPVHRHALTDSLQQCDGDKNRLRAWLRRLSRVRSMDEVLPEAGSSLKKKRKD